MTTVLSNKQIKAQWTKTQHFIHTADGCHKQKHLFATVIIMQLSQIIMGLHVITHSIKLSKWRSIVIQTVTKN